MQILKQLPKSLFIVLLLSITTQFFGQQNKIDSLQIVLAELDSDTAKIVVLNELAMKTKLIRPEASNKYAYQALRIAEENNYFVHIIDTYAVLAASSGQLGYHNITLEYLHKNLEIFEKEANNDEIAASNYKIAVVHNRRGKYDLSLEYLLKVIKHEHEVTDRLVVAHAYIVMGNIYLKNNNHEIAEQYWEKSKKIYEETNDIYGINYIRNSYAKLYEKTGQFQKAIMEYEKVLDYCTTNNNNNCVCPVLNHLGDVYREQKLFEKARAYYAESLEIAQQQGMRDAEMDSYLLLFKLDSLEGDYRSALANILKFNNIRESLFTEDKEKNISELYIKYETKQKADHIKSLQEKEKRKNEMIVAISIIVLLLLFALVFHWRMLRIKHKSNVQLENNNRLINKQKDEISNTYRKVKESEEKFRVFFENNKAVMLQLDAKTKKIVGANNAAIQFYGYDKEILLEKTMDDLNILSPDEISKKIQEAVKAKSNHFEFKHKLANNEIKFVDVYASPVKISKTTLLFVIVHDITNRIQAEKKLEKSEKRLRLSQQAGEIGVWEWDLRTDEIFWSKMTYQIFGVQNTSDAINNNQYLKYVHPDDKPRLVKIFDEFVKDKKKVLRVEYKIIRNNETRWIDETSELVFDKDGKAIKMIGVLQDISDRKKAELTLQESENRLKTLINSVPDLICFKDGAGRWLIANDADLKLFQLEDVDYIGKKDSELAKYSPFYYDAFMGCEDSDEQAWKEKGVSRVIENIPNPSGGDFIFDVIKVPVYNPDKTRNALVVFGRDITDIKKTEQALSEKNAALTKTLNQLEETRSQLVQSEKMASIGILTAGIAHEINNPVNFIVGGVNSLARDFEDIQKLIIESSKVDLDTNDLYEKVREIKKLRIEYGFDEALASIPEMLNDVKLGAERITAIVKSLGSFARSDDNVFHLFDIHESIENSLILLRNKYKGNIELIKKLDTDIPEIYCSKNKMNQIFLNLLSNAMDAISGKGEIYITTKLLNDSIRVSIKDTGAGISKELQDKVFDPFYTSKEEGSGMGLGLYIVYGFIQEHNGTINIISEPAKGSEFVITLPLNN